MLVVQCCVCGKVRIGVRWIHIHFKENNTPNVSHSYCPECARAFIKQINTYYNRQSEVKIYPLPKKGN